MHGVDTQRAIPANPPKEEIPTGNVFVHTLCLIWLVGVIIFDKNMAYISIGPIYITEFLLTTMILSNLRCIKKQELFLFSVLGFYLIGALIKGRDPFFAIRDLSWLYYLLFLKFFPRDFPKKYISIVMFACTLRALLICALPIMNLPMLVLFMQKYRDAAVILFLAGYFSLSSKNGNLSLGHAALLAVLSFVCQYKALMVIIAILPLALPMRNAIARWHTPKRLLIFALIIVLLIYTQTTRDILITGVESLNSSLSIIGVQKHYDTDTAIWRAEIWHRALLTLSTWADLLFGEFPGHNFMNSKYLGIKQFFLQGGDRLGTVRSAHNIIVQIVMKTGLFGLIVYGWYYFRNVKTGNPTLSVLRIASLLLAMTADILEVPSRGPLLFSLFVLLEIIFSDKITVYDGTKRSTPSSLNDRQKNRDSGDTPPPPLVKEAKGA